MKLRSIKEIKNLQGKKVIVRVDFNVPRDQEGNVKDDTRIKAALPTINYLRENGAKVILISHLGRPKGEVKEELRLTKIAKYISENYFPLTKSEEVIGEKVEEKIAQMQTGEVLLLENVRFLPEEKKCDPKFSEKLAKLGDYFVMDAFGAAHREHSSTAGIMDFLPSYAGLLLEKEIENLSPLIEGSIEKPLTMIFGGAKIDTKIGIIENFLEKADYFLIGGALANTFLAAAGFEVGKSFYEKDQIPLASEILKKIKKFNKEIILPNDVVVIDPEEKNKLSDQSKTITLKSEEVTPEMKIFDIGSESATKFCEIIKKSKTIIWNGPLGFCELKPFQSGTKKVAEFLAKQSSTSIIGGGDTADAIKKFEVKEEDFTHISTGGGACIEFLSGQELPAIKKLTQKS